MKGAIQKYFSLSKKILQPIKNLKKFKKEYDLAVIGGGSAGLSAAFEASLYQLDVIVIDYVEASPHNTKWGLGGTCVNVGCIPKKLMHQAAHYGQHLVDAYDYGWELPQQLNSRQQANLKQYFKWNKLVRAITNHIKSINFGYLAKINQQKNIDYMNAMATFKDQHTLLCSKKPQNIRQYVLNGDINDLQEISAKNVIIATGTRPNYLDCKGAKLAITSDDIFFKKEQPNKTLVVGGGYIAVEVAGFLKGMGYDISLITRGQYLRAFDRDLVREIIEDLSKRNINIIQTSLPKEIYKNDKGELIVLIQDQSNGKCIQHVFDTVIFAVGRSPTTQLLNLNKIGVSLSSKNKIKTQTNEVQRTNIQHIYALGDVVQGIPQLTSTAVKMGHTLARRIVYRMGKKQFKKSLMQCSLKYYPTTIFTPIQYSCCGLSEEEAQLKYGKDTISNYHIKFMALEENLLDKSNEDGSSDGVKVYAKAVIRNSDDKVLGLHLFGPHAGEIMQGFSVALKIGLTKTALDSTIGIHPTIAEQLTNMKATKQKGDTYEKSSC